VALTYSAAIDAPGRFRSSKAAGAHFGLTPKKYQSGETDVTGRISKIGDKEVRCALYEAAAPRRPRTEARLRRRIDAQEGLTPQRPLQKSLSG
jgi:transposase